jgi:hypothetical protein
MNVARRANPPARGSQPQGSVYPHPSLVYSTVNENGPGVGVGTGGGVWVAVGTAQAASAIPANSRSDDRMIHFFLVTIITFA